MIRNVTSNHTLLLLGYTIRIGIAPHGKEEAWQLAVDKIRELNPRGDIAQGRRYPTLQNLSGKQQEIANDF